MSNILKFLFFLTLVIQICSAQNIQDSLVAYYPFNDGAYDESGNSRHGTIVGARPSIDRNNNDAMAYYFNGFEDYVALPEDFDFPARTISIWFSADNVSYYQRIYNSDHPGLIHSSTNIDIHHDHISNQNMLRMEAGGGLGEDILIPIENNQWYHAVLLIDTLQVSAYLDGIFINTVPFINHHSDAGDSIAYIGTNRDKRNYFFNGSIDDARIYNRLLTDVEILNLFNESSYLRPDFLADINVGTDSLFVQFSDLSESLDSLKQIDTWAWDFENDGIIDSYEQNPRVNYSQPSFYSVKLVIADSINQATVLKNDYIQIYSKAAIITQISDVPNDQGGWVVLDFIRSVYDTDTLVLSKTSSTELYTVEANYGNGWIAANSTVAYGKNIYSILVPTQVNSMDGNNGLTNFRVIAGMDEGNYVSAVDSGYSMDNLYPSEPNSVQLNIIATNQVELSWAPNQDSDLKIYSVYKKIDDGSFFRLAQTTDTSYVDINLSLKSNYYYTLTATDFSGNESAFSEIVYCNTTSIDENSSLPNSYYLAQNFPNPFNPSTTIKYGLKESGNVKIIIYDILGKKIKELVNEQQAVGQYSEVWNGTNLFNIPVSSGIYFYYIQHDSFKANKKMLLLQ